MSRFSSSCRPLFFRLPNYLLQVDLLFLFSGGKATFFFFCLCNRLLTLLQSIYLYFLSPEATSLLFLFSVGKATYFLLPPQPSPAVDLLIFFVAKATFFLFLVDRRHFLSTEYYTGIWRTYFFILFVCIYNRGHIRIFYFFAT